MTCSRYSLEQAPSARRRLPLSLSEKLLRPGLFKGDPGRGRS